MSKFIDLTGQKFGRLLVLGRAKNSRTGITRFNCLCDCGKRSIVTGVQLRNGHTQSCGCLRKDLLITHNATNSRLYTLWWGIKSRCNNSKCRGYKDYGGRGIKICKEWLDFQNFHDWAHANGYNDTLTIDRIDVNGNYCPENCRWADMKFQGNHRRNNRIIEFQNQTHTVSEWSAITGINIATLYARLDRGWSAEKALST